MMSANIITWLKENDIFSIRKLERRIKNMPTGTIRQALMTRNQRDIPKKWLKPIVKELSKYGYK